MNISSNIFKIKIISTLRNALIATPIIVLFWQENGLNLTQIMFLQSIFAVIVVIFELPTGAFADIHGRKFSLAFGHLLVTVGISAYAFGHSFIDFVVAELFFGIGVAFVSGADSAMLYDTLLDLKKEKLFKKIYGNIFSFSLLATSVAAIIGSYIGQFSLRLALFVQIPIFFLAFLIALTIKEPLSHKKINKKKSFLKHISKSFRFAMIKNSKIRYLIIYLGIITSFQTIMLWFYQPYMKFSGLDIVYFGFAFAIFNLVAAGASKYAHLIEIKIGQNISLILPVILLPLGFFLFGSITWVYGAIFGILFQFVRGFTKPVFDDYINQVVWSEKRASVLSISSMFSKLLFAAISPFFGYAADVYSLQQSLLLSGVIVLFSCGLLLLLMRNSGVFKVKNV